MAVYVDVECSACGKRRNDVWSTEVGLKHQKIGCDGVWDRVYTHTPQLAPGTHSSEKVVIYQSALEGGKVQYPGRNDVPIPPRLRARGYERVELNVRDLAAFERKHGVANERRHFDRNGNGF